MVRRRSGSAAGVRGAVSNEEILDFSAETSAAREAVVERRGSGAEGGAA